jgi:YebC/PmpR family DNA-binding regulatory protein
MSGHSKWATIRHKKGAADAKRGKIFSKISKELSVCARAGGSDPDNNPTLRTLIQKAKSVNMPADNVERAIKKGAGELGGTLYEEVVYEGYAGGGVGIIVVALTDNKNRAAAEIRHIFNKNGSNFTPQGSVSRGFQRKGQIFVDAAAVDEETLMGIVLEAGADDLAREDDQYEILTDPAVFADVSEAIEAAGIEKIGAEVSLVPDVYMPVTDPAVAKAVTRFVEALEDQDDVQNVYTNMDVDAGIVGALEEE